MLERNQFVGAYRILECIGRGAMGAVYRAEHELIGRRVALKVIRPEMARHPEAIELFFREARAANQMAHPNIIQITDLVKGDGTTPSFMVMEHLDGFTLRAVLDQEGRLEPRRMLEIAEAIASAMAAAHEAGVIHRDLKPDNIFLCHPDGSVKILDFGIARLVGSHQPEPGDSLACGTPLYISPEQAGADAIDERTDIYSLGALLYEALAGRPVFEGEGIRDLLTAHIADPPEALVLEGAGASRLAALVMRCLEKSPEDRPPSMDDVVATLRDIDAHWDTAIDPELELLLETLWDEPPGRARAHVA